MLRRIVLFLCVFLSIECSLLCSFKLGIENLQQPLIDSLKNKKVGLIINQTSKNQQGISTVHVLQNLGVHVVALLAPEHGVHGTIAASADVMHGIDRQTKLPVISLYSHGSGRKIDAETMNQCDVLIFDIQDSGMRHYTYISTLYRVLSAAGVHDKKIIVLDRPNPLGMRMEGPLVEPDLLSFISIAPIPLRHGMTIGELALYFNEHILEKKAPLEIVPMAQYERTMNLPSTVSWHLSPNIKNKESCHGYSFLGLLGEIRPFNVSVGTEKAFQTLMLPADIPISASLWKKLKLKLQDLGIPTTLYSYFNEAKKKKFNGLHLCIDNIHEVQSWAALITIVELFKKAGIALRCSAEFDKAIGTRIMRNFIEKNESLLPLQNGITQNLQHFFTKARTAFLYKPLPVISEIK